MLNSIVERLNRFNRAYQIAVLHNDADSFINLIRPYKELFKGFRLIYSTNNIESKINRFSLSEINNKSEWISCFFSGNGLIFYSDEIYEKTIKNGAVQIPLDYTLSFDSNVANLFDLYHRGKQIQEKNKEKFITLIHIIKKYNFNFDYFFFILENLSHSTNPNNVRPLNTIMALKRFDYLDYHSFTKDFNKPKFNMEIDKAYEIAKNILKEFQQNQTIQNLLLKQKGCYLLILKAMLLQWEKKLSFEKKFLLIYKFCIESLGKFAKNELYFCWKFFRYSDQFDFFNVIVQPHNKVLGRARGISWDLFSMRVLETMATLKTKGEFFIPFFASLDNRFMKFLKACPLRFLLIDDYSKTISSAFFDEKEFQYDLNKIIHNDITIYDLQEKNYRMNKPLNAIAINQKITLLENEIISLIKR